MINVGIIGFGYASKTFHLPLIAATPGLTLAAASSSDPDRVHADWPALRCVGSPDALFADPAIDLVVIPTPNDTHFNLARRALDAGKHVVVDKPFTLALDEAHALDALALEKGRVLSVFHNRRWDADFLTLKRLFAEGVLGRVVHVESHFDRFRPEVRPRWREQGGAGSGLWYDLGPHLIDQALQFFGPPESLWLDRASLRDGALADDWFHAVLRYPHLRVVLHASALVAATGPRFVVHGTRGSYVKYGLDPQEDALKAGLSISDPDWGRDTLDGQLTLAGPNGLLSQPVQTERGNYPAYYAALRDAVNGIGPVPVSAAEAAQVMALIEVGLRGSMSDANEIRCLVGSREAG